MTEAAAGSAEAPGLPRAPLVVPGVLGGLAVADAGTRRVEATPDRRLLLHHASGTTELAGAGEVTRVVGTERDPDPARRRHGQVDRGVVGFLAGDRVAAILAVADWVPDPLGTTAAEARATSGIDAVVRTLGLVVEGATEPEQRLLRGARRRRVEPRSFSLRTTWWRIVAVLLAALTGLFATQGGGIGPSLLWYAVTTALLVPVVVRGWRERTRYVALDVPPPPGDRTVVGSSLPAEVGGLARAQLQVGRDFLVVHDRATQLWVPGPGLGGVTRAVRSPAAVTLRDRGDREVLVLDDTVWGRARVDEALGRAGVRVERDWSASTLQYPPQSQFGAVRAAAMRSVAAQLPWNEQGGGSAMARVGAAVAVPAYLAAGLACWSHAAWAAVLVVPPLVTAALVVGSWWTLRRWDRRALTRLTAAHHQQQELQP